jgi:hypothetical protein
MAELVGLLAFGYVRDVFRHERRLYFRTPHALHVFTIFDGQVLAKGIEVSNHSKPIYFLVE